MTLNDLINTEYEPEIDKDNYFKYSAPKKGSSNINK